MIGSTQTQIIQVEDLLRSFSETRAAPPLLSEDAEPVRSSGFNSRPIIAAFLAFVVFAPGCSAAAVFLMRADEAIPAITIPDNNPSFVTKSDRLPLGQWNAEAAASAGPKNNTRFAVADSLTDPAYLDPILIRGSLEDGTITSSSDSRTMPNAFASMDKPSVENTWTEKPRPKRIVSRVKPSRIVAIATPPELPQPSFFEKLFGPHVN